MKAPLAIPLLLAAAACAPEVPAEPTWVDDVRPILAANCIRCHSPPSIGGAPLIFRLDKYDDELIADTEFDVDLQPDLIGGAAAKAAGALSALVLEEMPPRFPLTGRQIDVIRAWVGDGVELPPRGEPRPDNLAPELTVVGDPVVSQGTVTIEYVVEDGDEDVVTGGVTTADQVSEVMPVLLSNEIFAGRGSVSFNMPSGTHELVAVLDDGSEVIEVDVGTVEVP